MRRGRENKLAGQIGEYLVCAELGRRGLIATPFSGNVPTFDVLAADAQLRTVPIQVKASRSDNWPSRANYWMDIQVDETGMQVFRGPRAIENPDLIYVCVAIAPPGGRDRFFVLTRADVQRVCIAGYCRFMERHGWRRPRSPRSFDNRYSISSIAEFEDNWELILSRLRHAAPDDSLLVAESEEDEEDEEPSE